MYYRWVGGKGRGRVGRRWGGRREGMGRGRKGSRQLEEMVGQTTGR